MENCAWALMICLAAALSPTIANAAFPTDCSDSCLGDYQDASCNSLCYDQTSDMRCDFQEALSDPAANVYAFADGGTFLVFGDKGGTAFCCDEGDFTANYVIIDTDDSADLVCAGHPGGPCDPPSATCTWNTSSDWDYPTLIRTRGESDTVYGSDYDTSCGPDETQYCDDIELGAGASGGSYGDYAEGGDGGDRIGAVGAYGILAYGDEGRDRIKASDGDSDLYGGSENDVLIGGTGDDYLVLGNGDAPPVPKQWANGLTGTDTVLGDVTDDIICGDWDTDSATDTVSGSSGSDRCTHPTEDTLTSCETTDTLCNNAPF
jgi:hypothetical protein